MALKPRKLIKRVVPKKNAFSIRSARLEDFEDIFDIFTHILEAGGFLLLAHNALLRTWITRWQVFAPFAQTVPAGQGM